MRYEIVALSPAAAKYTPQLLDYVARTQGVTITLPPPDYITSLEQYLKNLTQLVVFVR